MESKEDKAEENFDEKRTFMRFLAKLKLEVEYEIEGQSFKKDNNIIDICVGGLAFNTSNELNRGDVIFLRIPAGEPFFEGYGEVMWITGKENAYQVGIEFTKMTGASIDGVHKLLAKIRGVKPPE